MRQAIVLVGLALAASGAQAQQLNFANGLDLSIFPTRFDGQVVDPSRTYIQTQVSSAPGAQDGMPAVIRLSDFYATLPAASGASTAGLVAIAARLDRFTDRFREGIALAGSINVLPPNPGDRFAVSFGGAGYDGAGAGSISVSARLREDIIAYGAVARGPTQTLVKGGFGLSFR